MRPERKILAPILVISLLASSTASARCLDLYRQRNDLLKSKTKDAQATYENVAAGGALSGPIVGLAPFTIVLGCINVFAAMRSTRAWQVSCGTGIAIGVGMAGEQIYHDHWVTPKYGSALDSAQRQLDENQKVLDLLESVHASSPSPDAFSNFVGNPYDSANDGGRGYMAPIRTHLWLAYADLASAKSPTRDEMVAQIIRDADQNDRFCRAGLASSQFVLFYLDLELSKRAHEPPMIAELNAQINASQASSASSKPSVLITPTQRSLVTARRPATVAGRKY